MNREPSGGVATRRTKIVATLGPATGTDERIAALVDAGVNVVRVNASHGTAEVRGQWIAAVRRIAEARGAPIAVLLDLQGPRIRAGARTAGITWRCRSCVAPRTWWGCGRWCHRR